MTCGHIHQPVASHDHIQFMYKFTSQKSFSTQNCMRKYILIISFVLIFFIRRQYHILFWHFFIHRNISYLCIFLFIYLLYWFQITIEVNEPCLSPKPYIVHNTCHNNPSLFTPSLNTFFSIRRILFRKFYRTCPCSPWWYGRVENSRMTLEILFSWRKIFRDLSVSKKFRSFRR